MALLSQIINTQTTIMNKQISQIKIDLEKLPVIECPVCRNNIFQPLIKLRMLSKFRSGQPQDALLPEQVWNCTWCGTVFSNEQLINKDKQLKNGDKRKLSQD